MAEVEKEKTLQNYELIVMDIDDTLKEKGKPIPHKNIEAIQAAVRQRVHVALASGRPTGSIVQSLIDGGMPEKDCLNDLIIVGYNGSEALIKNELIYSTTLDNERASEILDLAKSVGANAAFFSKDNFYMLKDNTWKDFYEKKLGFKEVTLKNSDFKDEDFFKIVIMQDPKDEAGIKTIDDHLAQHSNEIEIFRAKTQWTDTEEPAAWVEVMPRGINKGYAVQHLCEKLGVDLADTIIMGDGINDKEMFLLPNVYPVAVKDSGYQEIIDIAEKNGMVTTDAADPENPGVSNAINKLIFNK